MQTTWLVVLCLLLASCAVPSSSGAPETASAAMAEPSPTSELSRDEAFAAARDALAELGVDWSLRRAQVGPLSEVRPQWEEASWGEGLRGDLRVWGLSLRSGSLSAEVIVGARDGTIYGSVVGVAD